MKKGLILVEGQTEETFIRTVLWDHLLLLDLVLEPVLATTKRVKSGLKFKGGITDYEKVRRDLLRLLGDSSAIVVTTMIDYYGLPENFPGCGSLPSSGCYERVRHLETALAEDLGHRRFVPYISLHEFEALLFVSPQEVGTAFPGKPVAAAMAAAAQAVSSPEEIDDGLETHPAKRLERLVPTYSKTVHGPAIARRIGLAAMRARCPHFNRWVTTLERLASP